MASSPAKQPPRLTSIATDTSPEAGQPNAPNIVVAIDTTLSETHTGTNQVTDHPVESGSDISDHSRPDPDQLSMDILITDSPISQQQVARAIKQGTVTVQSTAPQATPGRAEAAYQDLLKLKNQGILCKVVAVKRTYTQMAILSVTEPVSAKDSNAVKMTVTFKKIRIVQNKLTRTVVAKDPRAKTKRHLGEQTPQQTEIEDSAATKMFDGAQGKEGFFGKAGGAVGALLK